MNINTLKTSVAMSVVALAFAACSTDSTFTELPSDDAEALSGVRQLRLSVGGGVSIGPATDGTRSTNLDFQNNTFAEGTEIGIFILKENSYAEWLAASDRPYGEGGRTDIAAPDMAAVASDVPAVVDGYTDREAKLIADAYRDGRTYGYENIRARINADGSITRVDGLGFIYPLHTSDRVAVMAYAPYREDMTYDNLKSGLPITVHPDQNLDEAMRQTDILFGIPMVGIPAREAENVPMTLGFRHVMTNVRLYVRVANTPEMRSDSIIVRMRNVSMEETLLPMLTAEAQNASESGGGGMFYGYHRSAPSAVTMARTKGVAAADRDTVDVACCAVITPQAFSDQLPAVFEITLKGRHDGLADTTIVRTDPRGHVVFKSGMLSIYRTTLPSQPDDGSHGETLPDDGKDDVILGKPRR